MIATGGFLAALECTKFGPRTPLGELTALLQIPPSWFKGDPTSTGKGRRGEGSEGDGREEEGRVEVTPPPRKANSRIRP